MKTVCIFIAYLVAIGAVIIWATTANAAARGFVGPGTFFIVTPSGETIGTVNGKRITKPAPAATSDGNTTPPPTIRFQHEEIIPNPYIEWDCPRGMRVLRYGVRGC